MASRRCFRVAALTLSLVLVAALASAQITTGGVYGTGDDEQHQPLPGVTVTLSGETGAPQVSVTDEHGDFRFTNLYPGKFSLKAELDGFSPVEQNDIQVSLGSKRELALTLNSAVHETITVTAE